MSQVEVIEQVDVSEDPESAEPGALAKTFAAIGHGVAVGSVATVKAPVAFVQGTPGAYRKVRIRVQLLHADCKVRRAGRKVLKDRRKAEQRKLGSQALYGSNGQRTKRAK